MLKAWYWSAASLGLAIAVPLQAATVLEKTIHHQIQVDGSVLEQSLLRVRIESAADQDEWSRYPVLLDENRRLKSLLASVLLPDGTRRQVESRDTVQIAGQGELHSSHRFRLVEFPSVPLGTILRIEHQVEVQPYFPFVQVLLLSSSPIERLRVEVSGGDANWRWRISGRRKGLGIQEGKGGLVIAGEGLEAGRQESLLSYAWGAEGSWSAVGEWYEGLLKELPLGTPQVRKKARRVASRFEDARQRLEALLSLLRQQVRYVAVEVGIGGFRPSLPEEVLKRGWGDCKDQSMLLIALLTEAGIEAFPVLIHTRRRTDIDFPSPHFNHVVVAVPAEGLKLSSHDPVAEGLLFVDPTQRKGSVGWLHPAVQGQYALLVRGEASRIVQTPLRPQLESQELRVEVFVTSRGEATGQAVLQMTGQKAADTIHRSEAEPQSAERLVRSILAQYLPGTRFDDLQWESDSGGIPCLTISAKIRLAAFIQGLNGLKFIRPPDLPGLPSPDAEALPDFSLRPGIYRSAWEIQLPDGWCVPQIRENEAVNQIGRFSSSVSSRNQSVQIRRNLEIRQRWVEPQQAEALKQLALAQRRAQKKRIWLRCGD